MTDISEHTHTEVVGVFHDAVSLEAAVDELLSSGFDRAGLSLLAGENTVAEKLGHRYSKVAELEDDPAAPRAAYISTESIGDAEGGLIGSLLYLGAVTAAGAVVATTGSVLAAAVAAVFGGGAGSMIGTALADLVGEHHADYLQSQMDKGGLLLWVRTGTRAEEIKARQILETHSAADVHVHELPAPQSAGS